jgi:FkbM family methyltransferase
MLDGFWEIWLTQYLAKTLRTGMTVIDVGANFGYFTLLMADAVGHTGKVIAIEPNPQTVSLLRETIELNGFAQHTEIVASAAASDTGRAFLYIPTGEPKNSALVSSDQLSGGETVEVRTFPLDNFASTLERLDLIKIDAEGGELSIVAGMRELIAKFRPTIILEFNAARYPDPSSFLQSLLARYETAVELKPDGTIHSIDVHAVADRGCLSDRMLVFSQ